MRKKTQNSKLKTQSFFGQVIKKKEEDLRGQMKRVPFNVILNSIQDLNVQKERFRNKFGMTGRKGVAIIGEIKFATPTNPNLGSPSELLERASAYEKAGADAISIITEKHFFKGDISFVGFVKKSVKIPVLQKDFVIDEYQIYEAKTAGADALLLIARLVDKKTLKRFVQLCFAEGIEPIVEVYNEDDLKKAIATKTLFIAVNARDLRDAFTIDVAKACKFMEKIPNRFIKLGFSGIHSAGEVQNYVKAGARGVLVGTSLMEAKNIDEFLGGLR